MANESATLNFLRSAYYSTPLQTTSGVISAKRAARNCGEWSHYI